MIAGPTLYRLVAGVFAVTTVFFLVLGFRQPPHRRRFVLAISGAAMGLVVANTLVSYDVMMTHGPNGIQPNARYIGCFITFPTYGIILGSLSGAGTKLTTKFVFAINAAAAAALVNMHVPASLTRVMFGLVFLFILYGAYLLYRPMTRVADEVSGERRLAYKKLRNVGVMIWMVIPILGLLSAKQLGVLDPFTWLVMVSYMDLTLNVSFGLILYRSPAALDHIAGGAAEQTTERTDDSRIDPITSDVFDFPSSESGE
jgi:bacteriorhodopsin